jgi:hypothetical protein
MSDETCQLCGKDLKTEKEKTWTICSECMTEDLCEVCHKNEALIKCLICGKKTCLACSQEPRKCCGYDSRNPFPMTEGGE